MREFIEKILLSQTVKTRIAPTPSGWLHQGNAVNFVLNALAARVHPNGKLLLRIDDIDAARKRPEYVQDVFDTLEWLGIEWDEGPENVLDFEGNWSQNRRMETYHTALTQLRDNNMIFPCNKSRKELAQFNGAYPDIFRQQALSPDEPDTAWRANTPPDFILPCFIVRRRDGVPAYQIASVCDDIDFGITHIIRGADLEASTITQQWLAPYMGKSAFQHIAIYHHPLIKDDTGGKLSKSAGSQSLAELRVSGIKPENIYQIAANWLGLPEKNVKNLYELAAFFS